MFQNVLDFFASLDISSIVKILIGLFVVFLGFKVVNKILKVVLKVLGAVLLVLVILKALGMV